MKQSMESAKGRALAVAKFLDEHRGRETVAIDITEKSSFADFFIITTVNSMGHLRGLLDQLFPFLGELDMDPLNGKKRRDDDGWILLDCGFLIIHLMTEEFREFYDLERLWFGGTTFFKASSGDGRATEPGVLGGAASDEPTSRESGRKAGK